MAEKTTFVKIDRNIIRWGWFSDANTLQVFLYLIVLANIEDNKFRDVIVHRGELFTSVQSISLGTGRTIQEVKTALKHLISTNEITSKAYSFGQLISIVSYDAYQSKLTSKLTSKQTASKEQANSEQPQLKNIRSKEGKKESAPATPDGGGRSEWEIRRKLPDNLIGHFDNEEQFDSWLSGEGYDPH